MKKQKAAFLLSLLLIVFFGLISLPNFHFKIKGRDYNFNGVDFTAIGVNSDLLNLKKGDGIFKGKEVSGEVTFSKADATEEEKNQELKNMVLAIQKRINYSLLYDVKVRGEIKDQKYLVVFDFANHYTNPEIIASWLSSQGNVLFFPEVSSSTTNFSTLPLNDYDIKGNIAIESYSTGNYLSFAFRDEVTADFNNALPTGQYATINMIIGDNIAYNLYRKTNTDSKNLVLADATPTIGYEKLSTEEKIILLNVTKSYFLEEQPLANSVTISDGITDVSPTFAPEGASLIAVSLCIAFAVLVVLITSRVRLSAIFYFLMLSLLWVFGTISLLKLFGAFLSFATVVGFILSLVFVCFFNLKLTRGDDEDEDKKLIGNLKVFTVVLILNQLLLDRLFVSLRLYSDFFGVLMAAALTLFVVTYLYNPLLSLYLNNFPFDGLMSIKKINFKLIKNGK